LAQSLRDDPKNPRGDNTGRQVENDVILHPPAPVYRRRAGEPEKWCPVYSAVAPARYQKKCVGLAVQSGTARAGGKIQVREVEVGYCKELRKKSLHFCPIFAARRGPSFAGHRGTDRHEKPRKETKGGLALQGFVGTPNKAPGTGALPKRCAIGIGAGLKKLWTSSGTPKIRVAPECSPVTWANDNKSLSFFKQGLVSKPPRVGAIL
jgi:hypothetical protein